jgi:hypothetical protein
MTMQKGKKAKRQKGKKAKRQKGKKAKRQKGKKAKKNKPVYCVFVFSLARYRPGVPLSQLL